MIIYNSSKNKLYNAQDIERRCQMGPTAAGDYRDHFEKDYGRIVHSAAFRRLQAKTQIVGLDGGDFHRTRLTHSLEVAQIARGMIIKLNANSDLFHKECLLDVSLIEAAALAHDIGHPPFGHQGEQALHRCMLNYGGFEGNAHTFRILTRLEGDGQYGLNLTRGVLFATIKYPIILDDALGTADTKQDPPKTGVFRADEDAFQWILSSLAPEEAAYLQQHTLGTTGYNMTLHKTLESSIIELADDIAYSTHDIED